MGKVGARTMWGFLVWAAVVVAVWAASGLLLYGDENRGTFGDMFGAVNALFSGLAFAGVIYAIVLQRDELELQRNELEQTRQELAGQKEALDRQNETFARQTFESSFFQLLALQNEIVNAIDVNRGDRQFRGRDCFELFVLRVNGAMRDEEVRGLPPAERISEGYRRFYKLNQKDVAHYFRSLYHVVKFVDRSKVPVEEKRRYTSLVRAHLSSYELQLLFFNCLTDLGREKFKPLIQTYGLLKNMEFEGPVLPEFRDMYSPGAYSSAPMPDSNDGVVA